MTKYRIVKVAKEGYYKYYEVHERTLVFFWGNTGMSFNTVEEAKSWLKDQTVRQTKTVVEEIS